MFNDALDISGFLVTYRPPMASDVFVCKRCLERYTLNHNPASQKEAHRERSRLFSKMYVHWTQECPTLFELLIQELP